MKRLLLIGLLLCACSTGNKQTTSTGWTAEYSSDIKIQQTASGCSFTFPKCPDHLNYLTKSVNWKTAPQYLEVTATISGSLRYRSLDDSKGLPPSCRLYFQRSNDDMQRADGRWWSNPDSFILSPGTKVIHVSFDPSRWSNVYGKKGTEDLKEFNDAKNNIVKWGITCGGGNSFGHGDCAEADAQIKLDFKP